MDPFTQFIQSIPELTGSMQEMNRRTLDTLQANGQGGQPWVPEFIRQQKELGWL